MTTLQDKIQEIKAALTAGGIDPALRDIKYTIQRATGQEEGVFITAPDTALTLEQESQIDDMVTRRINGEPWTRIWGVREFWGLEFDVTPDTLDPRPDTETLVEAALAWAKTRKASSCGLTTGSQPIFTDPSIKSKDDIKILDLGTGTGCIAIALLTELPGARAVAVDISAEALAVARRNAARHSVADRFETLQSNWFEGVEGQEFDLIVSNPPYIPDSDIENLMPEVKNHDPIMALSGGKNGLMAYQKIILGLKKILNHKNRAFLEIGFGQLSDLTRLVDDSNLCLCDSHADIAGIPRVVEICSGDK